MSSSSTNSNEFSLFKTLNRLSDHDNFVVSLGKLKENSIDKVTLSFNLEDIDAFADALSNNTSLRSLAIRDDTLTHETLKKLLDTLNNKIETLALESQFVCAKCVPLVIEFMNTNSALVSLHFSCSAKDKGGIADEGAVLLGEALKENTTLRELSLTGQFLTKKGAMAVMDALSKRDAPLYTLSLAYNKIGPSPISEGLLPLLGKGLKSIVLDGCNAGEPGAVALAQAIIKENNQTIESISMLQNDIGMEGAKAFVKALQQCDSLHTLNVVGVNNQPLKEQLEVLTRKNSIIYKYKNK